MRAGGEGIAALTAYDYPAARLLEEAGIDLILVGDSVGMVVLGFEDTTHVTLEHMVHHTAAVARGARKTLIISDLPHDTYNTPYQALENATALMRAGAHAVKLEGGVNRARIVQGLVENGIPVMGHIGMLPQSVKVIGGYRMQGKTTEAAEALMADALALEEAGAFAMVLELVVPEVAARITENVNIPTIGIGAGDHTCDGQILVTHDLVGGFPWFRPKFAQPRANIGDEIRRAAREYIAAVRGDRD